MPTTSLSYIMTSRPLFRILDKAFIASIFILMAVPLSGSSASATLVVGESLVSDSAGKAIWQSGNAKRSARAGVDPVSGRKLQKTVDSQLPGRYSLNIGEYIIDKEVSGKILRAQSLGLEPDNMPGPRRMVPMTRLTVGEYKSRSEAEKTLKKLNHAGVDGLVLRGKDNKYRILLGSYADPESVKNELAHFVSKGIRVNSYRQLVPVPTKVLKAGSFNTREQAMKSAYKMEYLGVKCSLLEM